MRKISAVFLTIVMLLTMIAPAMAAEPALQHNYSSEANSGIRHEVCTTLAGTTVGTYYTGNYSFDKLATQSGDALLKSLRTLMSTTHTYQTSYDECRDLSVKTDCENADGTTINLTYTSYVVTMKEYINNATDGGGWNREHVWPKSLGGFNTTGAGADLHHIRPTDKSVNGKRGNEKYGVPTNGNPVTGTVTVENAVGGYSNNQFFEPLDNVKGDVARICLYVYVRYGGELSKCSSITNVFQSVDVLLEWCALDPVDTWEMGRNEVVYAIQGNRNVFIDYPELAWSLFSEEIPEDLVTPSGNTDIQPACSHKNVEYRNAVESSCTVNGYSGDAYCADCGIFLSEGTYSPSTGVHTFGPWANVEGAPNLQSRSCKECGFDDARTIPTAQPDASNKQIWVVVAVVAALLVLGGTAAVIVVVSKKKQ